MFKLCYQIVENLELEQILDPSSVPNVIHGTYLRNLSQIKERGLSRMRRNHIHCAPQLPNDKAVISGARSDSEVYIYIDLKKALNDGIKFYKSKNGVILTPGNLEGILEPKYFLKIELK